MKHPALNAARRELRAGASSSRARAQERYFKTRPGGYAAGDTFIGANVPHVRRISRRHRHLDLKSLAILIASRLHEERMLAVLILVLQYRTGDDRKREDVYRFYLRNLKRIDNWDLVDASCPHIIGAHLLRRRRALLRRLARSPRLWHRRISVISTFAFIRNGDFSDTLSIAQTLLRDREDLIHKAVGWMLREVGNRDRAREEIFLRRYAPRMPRTMLRYAIEKFPERLRRKYLRGKRGN